MAATLLLVFNRLPYNLGLGFNWTTDSIQGLLVDRSSWTPNRDDDFVTNILVAGAVEVSAGGYARADLTTPTVGLDDPGDRSSWDADPLDFGTVAAADPYDTLVLYRLVNNDTDSWLMAAWDLEAQTTNGTAIEIQPSVADGWFVSREDV